MLIYEDEKELVYDIAKELGKLQEVKKLLRDLNK